MHILALFSQFAVDPSNAKEGDDVGLDDAVLHDGAPKVESSGIENEMPSTAADKVEAARSSSPHEKEAPPPSAPQDSAALTPAKLTQATLEQMSSHDIAKEAVKRAGLMLSPDFIQAIIHGINGRTYKRNWQSRPKLMADLQQLLPFNANASHCNQIVDALIAMAAEADQTPTVVASVEHPFVAQLVAHPAAILVARTFIAELSAHLFYRMASQISVGRWRVMFSFRTSQGRPKRWHVDGIGDGIGLSIALQQRRTLLCRGALCALLVPRLLCFQGECDVRQPLNLAQHMASRRHFLGTNKDEAEDLFEKGQRLYGEQRFSEAAER